MPLFRRTSSLKLTYYVKDALTIGSNPGVSMHRVFRINVSLHYVIRDAKQGSCPEVLSVGGIRNHRQVAEGVGVEAVFRQPGLWECSLERLPEADRPAAGKHCHA